jgi:hypothetical protein
VQERKHDSESRSRRTQAENSVEEEFDEEGKDKNEEAERQKDGQVAELENEWKQKNRDER